MRALVLMIIALFACGALGAERPNIIIVLADDFGYGDVSVFGGEVPTPHLDRMAKEGTRFTQFYVASPICSPSRAGIITGQFPGRWRMTSYLQARKGNAGCEQADFLATNAPSLPRVLKSAGYKTAHIGKWHLGGGRDVTNAPKFAAYGYDVGLGTYESPEPHAALTATNWIWSAHDQVKRHERTRWMVDRTLEFVRARKDSPAFVNLWLDDTHTPFVPSREQLAAAGVESDNPTEQQKYRAVLVEMDRQIGRLLDGLREMGQGTNTFVLFLGDNGALPTFRTRNGKLRASKLSLYEGGIRTPLIAHWPGRVPAGGVNDTSVVAAVDLLPTLCALADASLPPATRFDGEDVSRAFLGPGFMRTKPLFWEYGRNTNWFKFPASARDRSPNVAMREGPWKLLVNDDGSRGELYNIVADAGETQNVAAREPEVTQRLTKVALGWRKSLPGNKPNIVCFIADDHGVLDSEVYGNEQVRTPNMRRLANAGLTFTHAFVASPSCAPSRAALLTGLMPARNGAEANHSKPRADIKKLPAYLKELGYEVAAFGKVSHYKHTKDYDFDHFGHDGFHEHVAIPAALKCLRERKSDKPLCLFVGSNWPHVPWPDQAEGYDGTGLGLPATHVATDDTRRARALYYSAVTRMDHELGQVYDAALQLLGSNTVFLHTSDHGAQFPFGKWNCYDAGIRVSLIITWPGVVKPATHTDAMVSWVDILPTLIEAAGGQAPADIDGRSFLPVLRGEKRTHRERIFATHSGDGNMNVFPMRSVRSADWKFILNLHPEFSFHTHIDLAPRGDKPGYWGGYWVSWTNAAKTNAQAAPIVARYYQRSREELYDLRNDPFETNNLATDPRHVARMSSLRRELKAWMSDQGDKETVFGKPRILER
jgi:N-sulfoglucosamine sulfohydrolase